MSDYSVTYYNPYNIYPNYGYNYSPYVGTITPAVNTDSIRSNNLTQLTPSHDSISFGANKQIQAEQKKKGMSTGAKFLLGAAGLAAAVYGGIVGHRALSRPTLETVQKNLSDILGRNLNKQETEAFIKKYKNICKEKNSDEYLQKLFTEVKNDCGYENLELALKIEKLKDGSFKSFKEHKDNGSAGCVNKEITMYPRTANNSLSRKNKRTLFGTMWHEFKHVKQCEQAYRTDPKALVDAYVYRLEKNHPEFIEQMMSENKCSKEAALKDIHEDIGKNLESLFGKYEKYTKETPEYEQGLKYIENARNYTQDGAEYFNQLVEKEAFGIGEKARSIFDYCSSIWRIF